MSLMEGSLKQEGSLAGARVGRPCPPEGRHCSGSCVLPTESLLFSGNCGEEEPGGNPGCRVGSS